MIPDEAARKRVHAALKDHGAEVLHVGVVYRTEKEWIIDRWDVQGITRESAVLIALEACNAAPNT